MKKILAALAIAISAFGIGNSQVVNAGLSNCSWSYTSSGNGAKARCTTYYSATPPHQVRVKIYCHDNGFDGHLDIAIRYGAWVYFPDWSYAECNVWPYVYFNAATYQLR